MDPPSHGKSRSYRELSQDIIAPSHQEVIPQQASRRAIVTLFRSTNFGCVAQALATSSAIEGTLVNYVDDQRRHFYERRQSDKATKATWETEFCLTSPVQNVEEMESILNERFDQVWVGSDELLKFALPGDAPTLFLDPFPTPYWLSQCVTISKILWAASIGCVTLATVPDEILREAVARLDDFEYLSVRDEKTLDFIRRGSPTLAQRIELVPDPTWLFWPRILFDSPMQYFQTKGVARSYHHLIAHLMRGKRVERIEDRRQKTIELAHEFKVNDWDESFVVNKCLECREKAWEFVNKVTRPISQTSPSSSIPRLSLTRSPVLRKPASVPEKRHPVQRIKLSQFTTLRMGGEAQVYAPSTGEEVIDLILGWQKAGRPYHLLGNGSNLLINDDKIPTPVIHTRHLNRIEIDPPYINVEAGFLLPKLVRVACEHSLGGIEYLISVPGTVGGGICMNAGRGESHQRFLHQHVESVTCFDGKNVVVLRQSELRTRHRGSIFHDHPELCILSARLKLIPSSQEHIRLAITDRLALTRNQEDHSGPNAGSVFRTPQAFRALLGQSVGKIGFSEKTPNWIINRGGTFSQALQLLKQTAPLDQLEWSVWHE